jgi:hypothetical protein
MIARRLLAMAAGVFVVFAIALAAGSVTGAAAKIQAVVAATDGSATFNDPVGDQQPGAPDIATVAISDITATGMLQVAVTVSGMQPGTTNFVVFLNTDLNPSTGASDGSDYALPLLQDEQGIFVWDVYHWGGSDWQEAPQSATMSFSRSGDVYTWTLSKADLGAPTAPGFTFWVASSSEDASGNVTARDYAPDDGSWLYFFSAPSTTTTSPTTTPTPAPAVKPVIGAPTTIPAKAVAGKHFTVTFPVTRSDNGAPLTSGKMICDPSIAGKVISHAESFTGGTAKLSFTVPKTAKGKLLKVKVTIKVGNKSTTKIATFHIG